MSAAQGADNPDRWMASYMDMVTVLMCLFIVLYAMSTVDQDKYEALRSSLASGFGVTESEYADTAEGVVVSSELVGQEGLLTTLPDAQELEGEADLRAAAQEEVNDLMELQRQLQARLASAGHEGSAEFALDSRGLTVRLVGAETFFESNSAELAQDGVEVLAAIAPVLSEAERQYEVGGHADHRTPADPFPTNWELSSSRATGVLRELVESGGVDPARIIAVGYGHEHPISEDLWRNRRVDVTILSDEVERVRDLLPELSTAPVGPAASRQ
ncbi:flagellar motor protein MotB [Nesterenkonia rhizosphaerae]|uniref:Flagellar motor protein MotB n=1 Tax=Nesterenkonia rhizosphaerae TaxID=1348272 RepID=A0ABP9FX27_9MICC